MSRRAFPVIYATDVQRLVQFYEELGFEVTFRLPEEGEAGYVTMGRDESELAVVDAEWPTEQLGVAVGAEPRFEMFVYVDDLEHTLDGLRDTGTTVIREPELMPWGERLAYVADPEGNPVSLAAGG